MPDADVVVVGAGLSGLACAIHLVKAGAKVLVLEAADRPGGRVRTDVEDGFRMDRGFQVLLTAYPEARAMLDYDALRMACFRSGAIVRTGGAFHTIADPFREPKLAIQAAFSPVGSMADRLRVGALRARLGRASLDDIFGRAAVQTSDYLENCGFSQDMVRQFFRPFLAGIFLEGKLATSSRKFEFVFRMFSEGHAALPADGMEAIPAQLAGRLPAGTIRCGTRVTGLRDTTVKTAGGEEITARRVVLAMERPETLRLTGKDTQPKACSTVCLYFDAPESPAKGRWLVLNGEGSGPVNNLSVPSDVCPSYAPAGRALVSVTVVGLPEDDDRTLESRVREQLTIWYGPVVRAWRHLRTYRIPYAVPLQGPNDIDPLETPPHVSERVLVCGDYTHLASSHGALVSGRRAAEAALKDA